MCIDFKELPGKIIYLACKLRKVKDHLGITHFFKSNQIHKVNKKIITSSNLPMAFSSYGVKKPRNPRSVGSIK
jgi:hypothetical protein